MILDKHEIVIDKLEYEKLLSAYVMLQCLKDVGVDNWDGYDYAVELYRKWDNE